MDKSTGCGLFKPQIRDTSYGDFGTFYNPSHFQQLEGFIYRPIPCQCAF